MNTNKNYRINPLQILKGWTAKPDGVVYIQKKYFLCTIILMQSIMMLQAQSSNPVGAIPGVVDVSPMGAATYTIPIEVVPGTQGMQPNLSVTYNSFGGMGLLGMKWNLTGLSAITRCGQVPYYDNEKITAKSLIVLIV